MFFWVCVFATPIYYTYGIYGRQYEIYGGYPILRWFIGNFGGSSMFCKQVRQSVGKIGLECPPGSILETDKGIFGVISNEFGSFTYCQQSAMDPVIKKEGHQNCTEHISTASRQTFAKELKRKCRRK